MSIYKELAYNRVVSNVKGIQFFVLSEQEILKRSVCEVTENKTFDGNEPTPNGTFDTRMGVIDPTRTCATCMQRSTFCPGHFGHIRMAKPVFYVQFHDYVGKILKCVCFRCSKLLINVENPEIAALLQRKSASNQKRWEAISKLCQRVKRCGQETLDGCGARKPDKIVKEDDMRFKMQWRESGTTADAADGTSGPGNGDAGLGGGGVKAPDAVREQIFDAEDVLRILRRITDSDAEALGYSPTLNRPEWMICTVLPVPPPSVRPSVRIDTGQRQEDDLTHKLCDIIKHNNAVRDRMNKGVPPEVLDHFVAVLQYHVATLIDNNSVTTLYPSKDRTGRTMRSLCERLKHKEGRIRGNLMGKRVDFSARTVITPDPNLSIDELGVPLKIAMNLTFPEVVNAHNMAAMRQLVLNGPERYPGAKHVRKTRDGNRTIRLKGHPDVSSIVLDEGDVVERHLRNGDYVLFNRQPSLHKMSMMAHRVRVMEYNTFRLNVCVCASYNADFDGDEMNMHVPQSLQTHYELQQLAAVPLHVLSPRYSMPIISIVQDVALGVFRVTQGAVRVSQSQLFNLVASNPLLDPARLPPPREPGRWSGRQLLSTVLPPAVSVRMASSDKDKDASNYDPDNDEVIIENGMIKSGILNARVYGKESKGLVHATYNSLGPSAVTAMLNNTQKVICDWLVMSGFSVGISDLVVNAGIRESMQTILAESEAKAYEMLHAVHRGTFENASTKNNKDYLEERVMALLSKGANAAGKIGLAAFTTDNNRMLNMIQSGSKGRENNFTQMVACLGPQSIENRMVPDGFDNRTLPHNTKFDDGPRSRGFITRSFIEGLEPHEFFFHAMAGRIGLIDTAVRTSETGYLQRKLVKAMEDCKVHHDLTVRNASGFVVQFLYGEDGMDAVKLEYQKLPYMSLDPAAMREPYFISSVSELRGFLREDVLNRMADDPGAWRQRMEDHFRRLVDDRRRVIMEYCGGQNDDKAVVYPVNIARIVESTSDMYRVVGCPAQSDLDPVWVLDQIALLEAELRVGIERLKDDSLRWMPLLLRCFLSPKPLIKRYRLNRVGMERVVSLVRSTFQAAVASPSEMVGIVAAQSIGEPTTQLSVVRSSSLLAVSRSTVGGVPQTRVHHGPIGDIVDDLLVRRAAGVVDLGGGSVVLDLDADPSEDQLYVVSITDQEKTAWTRVSQVSRHPANGGLVEVTTRSGRRTVATLSHSFLKRRKGGGVQPVLGSDLRVGDRVPVAKRLNTDIGIDLDLGSMMTASAVAEGVRAGRIARIPPSALVGGSLEFSDALCNALFCGDVHDRLECGTRELAEDVALLLAVSRPLSPSIARIVGPSDSARSESNATTDSTWTVIRSTSQDDDVVPDVTTDTLAELFADIGESFFEGGRCPSPRLLPTVAPDGGGVSCRQLSALVELDLLEGALERADAQLLGIKRDAIKAADAIGSAMARDNVLTTADASSVSAVARQLGVSWRRSPTGRYSGKTLERLMADVQTAAVDLLGRRQEALVRAASTIAGLRTAVSSDVVWDEIVSLKVLEDPGSADLAELVYDLTVPGTESFMVDGGHIVHNTLNTFHLSGVASASTVTQGVPRMKELVSASKNIKTPAMTVRLRREFSTSMERAAEVMSSVQTTRFKDLVRASSVHFDPSDAETTIEDDREFIRFYNKVGELDATRCDATASPWLLRFELDRSKMLDLQVTMIDLQLVLQDFYEDAVTCLLTDDNSAQLVCRMRLNLSADGSTSATASSHAVDVLTDIKALEQSVMENVVVKGVSGIEKAMLLPPRAGLRRYDDVLESFVPQDEWSISTDGSNMLDVMGIDFVDYTRTATNDVAEVFTVLGIEAARQVFINELRVVLGDLPLNDRHISLLADNVTNRGFLMSIDRHSISHRGEMGPLAKCSFELTTDMLIKAGVFGERDRINGVSANIMLGQVAPCGTGDTDVFIDHERLVRMAKPVSLEECHEHGVVTLKGVDADQAVARSRLNGVGDKARSAMPVLVIVDDLKPAKPLRILPDAIEIIA
jgi:DNA-directed RNA polymerase beta' subunit